MSVKEKLYKALVGNKENNKAIKASVYAVSLDDAREKLQIEYDTDEIIYLHTPEDAEKLR